MRRAGEVGLEQALELEEGLVVEDHRVEVGKRETRGLEAPARRHGGEVGIVATAREAFFLRGRDHVSVDDQGRRSVVIICGNTENSSHARLLPVSGTVAKGPHRFVHEAQDPA